MNLTTLFRLRKPEGTDPVDVKDFNDNFDVIDAELGKRLEKTGNGSDLVTAFSQAGSRANLTSGERLSLSFGKIMKWFADLKVVAFSGNYNDLANKPSIPGGAAANYAVADNDLTNNSGYLATARVAYEHGREIDQISSDLVNGRMSAKWETEGNTACLNFYIDKTSKVASFPQWTQGSLCTITYESGDFYANYSGVKKKLGNEPLTMTLTLSWDGNNPTSRDGMRAGGSSKPSINVAAYKSVKFDSVSISNCSVTANGTAISTGTVIDLTSVNALSLSMSGSGSMGSYGSVSGSTTVTLTLS